LHRQKERAGDTITVEAGFRTPVYRAARAGEAAWVKFYRKISMNLTNDNFHSKSVK
jgi:hypothetical protein